MKEQCRTCGEWFKEEEMIDTDYRTYAQQGDLNEMVCEGCYDTAYGKCSKCGAIREGAHLVKNDGEWVCNHTEGDWDCNYNEGEHRGGR